METRNARVDFEARRVAAQVVAAGENFRALLLAAEEAPPWEREMVQNLADRARRLRREIERENG